MKIPVERINRDCLNRVMFGWDSLACMRPISPKSDDDVCEECMRSIELDHKLAGNDRIRM